jgi:superfamily II DNA helicase RecQ
LQVVIVFSPLKSLIQDQVESLISNDIIASYIDSDQEHARRVSFWQGAFVLWSEACKRISITVV